MGVVGEQAEIWRIKASAEPVNSTANSCYGAVFMHNPEQQRRERESERERRDC
jgi:hypothetical protein